MKNISELRQDIVTGDWAVVATGRSRRPDKFAKSRVGSKSVQSKNCPFEHILNPVTSVYDQRGDSFRVSKKNWGYLKKNWWLQVAPNKYPAFSRGVCSVEKKIGPYLWQDGAGFHEVVITRDHHRVIGKMSNAEVAVILRAYRDRYLALKDEDCVEYISIFHNHGHEAGASLAHPHSQIIAIPVVPPDVGRSIRGSEEYFKKKKKCPHCVMLDFEFKEKKRIIFANNHFVALCPFVSRQAFEIRIFPIKHTPHFEKMTDSEITAAAEVLNVTLAKLSKGLNDPAYNFFIHTAPTADGQVMDHYHWHLEILPKTAVWAGFEIGTGIEISTISPESAGQFLSKIKVASYD